MLHIAADWPGQFPNGPAIVLALAAAGADVNAPVEGPRVAETALHWAVAIDVLERVGSEARQALDEEPDVFRALIRYMHRALDFRTAAVMQALLGHIALEAVQEIRLAREVAVAPVLRMIELARDGALRTDVAFGDVGLMLVRLSRPLPGEVPRELDDQLAHRRVELPIKGLCTSGERSETDLPGPALSLADLRTSSANA